MKTEGLPELTELTRQFGVQKKGLSPSCHKANIASSNTPISNVQLS